MNTFFRFFYEFVSIFIGGITDIFKGIYKGITKMFNIFSYKKILQSYGSAFNVGEWILAILTIVLLTSIVIAFLILVISRLRKYLRLRRQKLNQDELLDEIDNLNNKVRKLMKEKDELMAMKVSQLGLSPDGEEGTGEGTDAGDASDSEDPDKDKNAGNIRFPKLNRIDQEMEGFKAKNYNNNFTLEELIDNFRCFAASQLHLYYNESLLRAFFGGLACSKLIILQGISGTGKTSLAYAWGKFVKHNSCIASVQPSWRDKTELLGYFNEFTKKFNESNVLEELYISRFDDDVHTVILDEMNIARVEYYFAEMLSVLEVPNRNEWVIELVTTTWLDDPKLLDHGKLKLPSNLWYIGTINNDDSTFMVTDKVYDRAMPIDINEKIDPFACREQEAMDINCSYVENLFNNAIQEHAVSEKGINIINKLDDYVIQHFRIAFGNRIMKQLKAFVPVYVACGGDEVSGIDYFLAKKVLRKFEQLNLILIRDEIDGFIKYLNKEFGTGNMKECIEFLERLKKSA
ncbi:MAG: hypothetical protein J5892_01750 [Bacilli bacterium]|nr:hypothetical protein [Bacilli bacterium]